VILLSLQSTFTLKKHSFKADPSRRGTVSVKKQYFEQTLTHSQSFEESVTINLRDLKTFLFNNESF